MKKLLSLLLPLLIGVACQHDNTIVPVEPEYNDWYVVKAPINEEVINVWGDVDKTLLISTMFKVYRSTDSGKSWKQVIQQSLGIFGVVQYQDTLLTMTGLANERALISPDLYSTDDGLTWRPYPNRYSSVFEYRPYPGTAVNKRFFINPVTTSSGTTYQINRVFLDGPTATSGSFDTPGVIASTGQRLDLPKSHLLKSLYLDSQSRLYITGSDAICSTGRSGSPFAFCNGGKGVIYISKKPVQ